MGVSSIKQKQGFQISAAETAGTMEAFSFYFKQDSVFDSIAAASLISLI